MSGASRPGQAGNLISCFPVYQVEFQSAAAGRHIAATKRTMRWKYGHPNAEALNAGETGLACRGREHEITVKWSITSGKRVIHCDGKEIYNVTERGGLLEHSWVVPGNHTVKVVANATPSLGANPGSRQYDLFVDGQSFFNMPKMYELGLKGSMTAHDRVPGAIPSRNQTSSSSSARNYDVTKGEYVTPKSQAEEEQELKNAIAASLQESRSHFSNQVNSTSPHPTAAPMGTAQPQEENLIDFFSEPVPAPVSNVPTPVSHTAFAAPAPTQAPTPVASHQVPVNQFGVQAPCGTDPFAPHIPASVPIQPSYDDISNQILQSYSSDHQTQSEKVATESVVQLGSVPAPTVPTTNQVSSEEKRVAHDAQMDALMGKLANFGDLAGPVAMPSNPSPALGAPNPFYDINSGGSNTSQQTLGQMKGDKPGAQKSVPLMNYNIMATPPVGAFPNNQQQASQPAPQQGDHNNYQF